MSDDFSFFFFFFKTLVSANSSLHFTVGHEVQVMKNTRPHPPPDTPLQSAAHTFLFIACVVLHAARPPLVITPQLCFCFCFFFLKAVPTFALYLHANRSRLAMQLNGNYANRWALINLTIHRTVLRSDCSHLSHARPTQHNTTQTRTHTPISRPSTSNFSHISSPRPRIQFPLPPVKPWYTKRNCF